ncbi:MAG: MFS transporter [Desulfovibrio sp.]|jgi:sugar phosphate permease|nr:MFS transporter [Desulfovibrio sp.]
MKNFGYSGEQYGIFRKYALNTLFGFAIMYAFFYNGRMNMGLSLASMTSELHISTAQAGAITSSLFWCYGFGHLFSGRLGEIFGNKRFILVGILLSVLLNLVISFQTSPAVIAVFWGLNGFAQAMVFSPGIALSAKWWPKSRRGFASGIITGFAGIAQISAWLCILAAFALQPDLGWRAAFRLPMIPMFVFGLFFLFLAKEEPSTVGLPDYQEEDPEATALEAERNRFLAEKGKLYPYISLFKNPKMILFMFIIAIIGIARYGLITWLPLYYVKVMDMNIKSGIFNSVVLPIGMAVGYFLMPILSDKIFKSRREPPLIICSVCAAVAIWIFPYLRDIHIAAACLLLVGFFSAINGLVWAFAADIGTRAFAGTATGMLDWAAYMGAAIQSILFGAIIDSTGNWDYLFFTLSILFLITVSLALVSTKIRPRAA